MWLAICGGYKNMACQDNNFEQMSVFDQGLITQMKS